MSADYPAIIDVTGFDYITAGDLVEIHFLQILNGNNQYNDGNVKISAFKTKGDGTLV